MKTVRSSGFTLVEMMITIAIIAIMASVAVPSFVGIVNSQRVTSASYDLYASLISARSEALKRNGDVTLTSSSGGWSNGWQIIAADSTVLKNHEALKNVVVSTAPSTLTYKRTGRLSATSSPSFQLDVNPANSNYTRCISIDLSGLPRTKKGACS